MLYLAFHRTSSSISYDLFLRFENTEIRRSRSTSPWIERLLNDSTLEKLKRVKRCASLLMWDALYGPFEKSKRHGRSAAGTRHSNTTGTKPPTSLTVPTRLSATDYAPLLGGHVAGPYSNGVLSLYTLCTPFHLILSASVKLSALSRRYGPSHRLTRNIDTN